MQFSPGTVSVKMPKYVKKKVFMTGENISKYYADRKDTPIQKREVRNKRPKITNFRWFYKHVAPFRECLR